MEMGYWNFGGGRKVEGSMRRETWAADFLGLWMWQGFQGLEGEGTRILDGWVLEEKTQGQPARAWEEWHGDFGREGEEGMA